MATPQSPRRQPRSRPTTGDRRALSPSPSQLPPIPPSPAMSFATTTATANPFLHMPPPPRPAHAVLTKADLDASQAAYSDLISSAKTYRQALAALGDAASAFGSALEACARLKEARAPTLPSLGGGGAGSSGHNRAPSMTASFTAHAAPPCTADPLLAASGLQHLIANHHQILGETVYRSFEVPLLHELDKWRRDVDDEGSAYEAAARAQGREIRRLEKEGVKMQRQTGRRDVARFRSHLVELTAKLDGLTSLHAEHARALLRDSQDTSVRILDAACSLARAEVDIFESLARKGWTGGGLEDLLDRGVDLFAAEEDGSNAAAAASVGFGAGHGNGAGGGGGASGGGLDAGSKLFSILPPKSILADAASETTRPGHHRADSLLVDSVDDEYQSLASMLSPTKGMGDRGGHGGHGGYSGGGGGDAESFVSEFNRPRGARPFSPQPIPVGPDDDVMNQLYPDRHGKGISARSRHILVEAGRPLLEEEEEEEGEGYDEEEGQPQKHHPQEAESSSSPLETPTPRAAKAIRLLQHYEALAGDGDEDGAHGGAHEGGEEPDPWRDARSPSKLPDDDGGGHALAGRVDGFR